MIDFNDAVYEYYRLADEFNRLLVQGTYQQAVEAKKHRDDMYDYCVKINGGTNRFPDQVNSQSDPKG